MIPIFAKGFPSNFPLLKTDRRSLVLATKAQRTESTIEFWYLRLFGTLAINVNKTDKVRINPWENQMHSLVNSDV